MMSSKGFPMPKRQPCKLAIKILRVLQLRAMVEKSSLSAQHFGPA